MQERVKKEEAFSYKKEINCKTEEGEEEEAPYLNENVIYVNIACTLLYARIFITVNDQW